jgi:hypothetical protein
MLRRLDPTPGFLLKYVEDPQLIGALHRINDAICIPSNALASFSERKTGNGFTGPEVFSGIPGWLSRYKKVS